MESATYETRHHKPTVASLATKAELQEMGIETVKVGSKKQPLSMVFERQFVQFDTDDPWVPLSEKIIGVIGPETNAGKALTALIQAGHLQAEGGLEKFSR